LIWTAVQLALFVGIMMIFYFSGSNYFMQTEDCCEATEYLTRTNNELPLKDCSNLACPLRLGSEKSDYTLFSGSDAISDDRPRRPLNGKYSHVFAYQQEYWCCNLDAQSNQCCNGLEYGISCYALATMAGFSAVCAMLMTQVTLQGFYSFMSRRSSCHTLLSVFIGTMLRLVFFTILFYFFFGFMFIFCFFWVPMIFCDNPYAYEWWKFGYLYVYYFFENFVWMLTNGLTEWDGNMDFDTVIATHMTLSVMVDFLMAMLYVCLSRIKDDKGQVYFHLTFFRL